MVDGGRASAVLTADGTRVAARRAVLADVVAPRLYGGLVAPDDLPAGVVRGMRDFRARPWHRQGRLRPLRSGALGGHARPDAGDRPRVPVTDALTRSWARWPRRGPAEPFLLMGQMTTTDPTRSPAGTESCWIYSHVPQRVVDDAGDVGGTIRGVWDADDRERFADRMQDQVERVAPGFGERVLARRVLGPRELEARDANLVGGAVNGGTSQLHQQRCSVRSRGGGGPRRGSAGSTSRPRRPIRGAASMGRPGERSPRGAGARPPPSRPGVWRGARAAGQPVAEIFSIRAVVEMAGVRGR